MRKQVSQKIFTAAIGLTLLSATAWGDPPPKSDGKDFFYWQLQEYDKSLESFHEIWSQTLKPRNYSNDPKTLYYQQLQWYRKHQMEFADALSTISTPKTTASTPEQLYQRQTSEFPKTKEEFRVPRKKYKR